MKKLPENTLYILIIGLLIVLILIAGMDYRLQSQMASEISGVGETLK